MIVIVFVIGLLAGLGQSWADEARPERATLTVSGTGQLLLAPDTSFVSLGVETAGKSLVEAQRENQAAMAKIMKRLQELRIDKAQIQTASFTVSPQYKPPPQRPPEAIGPPPEIIGYIVSNSAVIEVRELEKVGPVIDGALAAGGNQLQGVRWALRDEQQPKLAALRQAAGRAREKAEALSATLHVKLLRLVTVNEESHLVHPVPRLARAMAADGGTVDSPLYPGEVKVEATVTLMYEIARE